MDPQSRATETVLYHQLRSNSGSNIYITTDYMIEEFLLMNCFKYLM